MKTTIGVILCAVLAAVCVAQREGEAPAEPHGATDAQTDARRGRSLALPGDATFVQATPSDNTNVAPIPGTGVRFAYLDIFVDAGDQPLAAYQFDLSATTGDVTIVGIEGSEHDAFRGPPYHDPAAIQNDRAIIAYFSTSPPDDLPRDKTRVARVHVQVTGDAEPQYDLKLTVAASADGTKLPADITLEQGNGQ